MYDKRRSNKDLKEKLPSIYETKEIDKTKKNKSIKIYRFIYLSCSFDGIFVCSEVFSEV